MYKHCIFAQILILKTSNYPAQNTTYRYYEDIRKELKFDLLFTQAELAEQLC